MGAAESVSSSGMKNSTCSSGLAADSKRRVSLAEGGSLFLGLPQSAPEPITALPRTLLPQGLRASRPRLDIEDDSLIQTRRSLSPFVTQQRCETDCAKSGSDLLPATLPVAPSERFKKAQDLPAQVEAS